MTQVAKKARVLARHPGSEGKILMTNRNIQVLRGEWNATVVELSSLVSQSLARKSQRLRVNMFPLSLGVKAKAERGVPASPKRGAGIHY